MTLQVTAVMTRSPVCVDVNTRVDEAEREAEEKEVRHLMVTRGKYLAGVACVCDLRRGAPGERVARYMSTPVLGVPPTAAADEAADLIRRFRIGCVPVVEYGVVRGVVTRSDLRRAGYSAEQLGVATCVCCGGHHEVAPIAEGDPGFCLECRELAVMAEADDELGGEA